MLPQGLAGYRITPAKLQITLDVLNLFDKKANDIEYWGGACTRNEAMAGTGGYGTGTAIDGRLVHPLEPHLPHRAARQFLTRYHPTSPITSAIMPACPALLIAACLWPGQDHRHRRPGSPARQGRRVTVFKCGPDFLDPQIHAFASGRPARTSTSACAVRPMPAGVWPAPPPIPS